VAFDVTDWRLGQFVSALPEESVVYLTPTQVQMATIYFALDGELDRLRSFFSPENLTPAGHAGQPAVYLIRPMAESTLERLKNTFPVGSLEPTQAEFTPFILPAGTARLPLVNQSDVSWGGAIALHDWSAEVTEDGLLVTLYWQAGVEMERGYTAFVHLLAEDGTLIGQLDRPPDGYPTSDWRPGEIIIDRYLIELPADMPPDNYVVQTGFYFFPTLERLGEPVVLGDVRIR
jgi:hypothetical protein